MLCCVGCADSKAPAAAVPACDSGNCTQPICSAEFSGNTLDSMSLGDACGGLTIAADAGPDGAYLLSFHGSSTQLSTADVGIYLGAAPATGTFSAESLSMWTISASSNKNPGCEFRAGSSAVPNGDVTLTLTSVTLTSADATSGGAVHGSLSATLYVHAPPATECGPGDLENAVLVF
jgi:hypothetical protein